MYKKMTSTATEYNKQNFEIDTIVKKEEKKFRLKPKKNKTSLVIKRDIDL